MFRIWGVRVYRGHIYIYRYICSMTTTATTGNEAAPPNEKVTYKRGG